MFCTNCGVKNQQEAKFCKNCGQPLKVPAISNTIEWSSWALLLAFLVVLVVVGVLLYLLSGITHLTTVRLIGSTSTSTPFPPTSTILLSAGTKN